MLDKRVWHGVHLRDLSTKQRSAIIRCKNIREWFTIAKEILKYNKDDALLLYNYVFDKPYAHLDIDTVTNTYYKNFNELVITN
jgi:hypothetical protein